MVRKQLEETNHSLTQVNSALEHRIDRDRILMQQLNEGIARIKAQISSINEDFVADKCDLDQMMDRVFEQRDLKVLEITNLKKEIETIVN
jgi:hypothetical protein